MEGKRLHWKAGVAAPRRVSRGFAQTGKSASSESPGTSVSLSPTAETSNNKNTKSSSWGSSISTITEELPSADVPEAMTRVPSASSASRIPYCSTPGGSSLSSSSKRENSTVEGTRSWNTLPRAGETLHLRKHSMNVAIHTVNGTPKQIVYDPRYNPLCPKLGIFYMFNAQSPPLDAYTHAKLRLESFVKFLETYHGSRKYAAACLPFNVTIAHNSSSSGYPSYTSGVSYNEIGEVLQLWYLQALKFLLDKNSFLFSSEIVEYLVNSNPGKNVSIKNDFKDKNQPVGAFKETVSRADILLIRCSLEEEFGWQLALDEPNWNVVDLFVDFARLRKPSFATGQEKNSDDDNNGNAMNSSHIFSSSSESSFSSATSNLSTASSSNNENDKEAGEDGISSTVSGVNALSESTQETDNGAVRVLDCVGRDLELLYRTKRTSQEFEEASRRSSVSGSPSQESVPEQQPSANKSKSDQPGLIAKGSSALGLSNFFRRKNSHAATEKSESPGSTRQSSPGEPTKINLNIQNQCLEDYYSSTLANYRRIVPPSQSLFTRADLPKEYANRKKSGKSRSYQEDFLRVRLPLEDNSFPVVICPDIWFTVELKRWKGFLSEIFRCIKPGGYLETSTCNFSSVNDFSDAGNSSPQFSTSAEMRKLKDVILMGAARAGIQVYPMRHLVQVLKKVGFVNIKHSVVSLKIGDLTSNMGMLFEFLAIRQFDFQLRTNFLTTSTTPEGTDPASLPLRFVQEHMGKVDESAGVLRFVLITAQKPGGTNNA
ncbi:LAFA_0C04192g1_1 [Lachancea sp. 'fantastica']|nr:LAFA_0C04192g1_1 [Lachancea sp. 'fantastica']